MNYENDNLDLDSLSGEWDEDNFPRLIKYLKAMPREQLLKLCRLPEIKLEFSSASLEDIPTDEIANVLVSDFTPDILIPAIKKLS